MLFLLNPDDLLPGNAIDNTSQNFLTEGLNKLFQIIKDVIYLYGCQRAILIGTSIIEKKSIIQNGRSLGKNNIINVSIFFILFFRFKNRIGKNWDCDAKSRFWIFPGPTTP